MPSMWIRRNCRITRVTGFFLINLSHETLENYYRTNFQMMQHFNYSLTELDNMMPWEREVYLTLLNEHIEEQQRAQETG